jgi:pimeloyl-ACP methyl ester carboxylesterase
MLIGDGYAWAASSYGANGYAVGLGAEDTRALADLFAELVGEPRRTYLYGTSMGGHITTFLMEQYPDEFDGAMAECGAVAGVEVLSYFVSWWTVASQLTGVEVGLITDAVRFAAAADEVSERLGPADSPTQAGRRFESVITELTGGPRPWRHEGFAEGLLWNFPVILESLRHPEAPLMAATNEGERYHIASALGLTDAELNRAIPRVAAAPDVRDDSRFPELAPVSGRIERPYLTISNTGDFFVPISQQQIYRRAVRTAGREEFLVQRAVRRPGHCNFTAAERGRAFDDLVRWVEEGVRPPGDDLLGGLMDVGLEFTEPLLPRDPGAP